MPAPAVYPAASIAAVASDAAHSERIFNLIRPVLVLPRGSAERGAAIKAIADSGIASEAKIRRRLRQYENELGIASLARKRRSDAGQARFVISDAWDGLCKALSIPLEKQRYAASKLQRRIRSLWAEDTPGRNKVRQRATEYLAQLTRHMGVDVPIDALLAACRVPVRLVEAGRNHQVLAIRRSDAKRVHDRHLPVAKRSRTGMLPLDCVAGDVHPVDVAVRRSDGSVAHARMIAWYDLATNRALVHLFLLEKGEGIRQEHVIESFIAMVEAWGLPRALYVDRGGEYFWTEFVADAQRLGGMAIRIIRALPYNARAKFVETFFAVWEGRYGRIIPGWRGGDRMRAKTANVGKAPPVFPGTFEEFERAVAVTMVDYNRTGQSGHLDGRSPDDAWRDAVAAGWRPFGKHPAELQAVFCTEHPREVINGTFTHLNVDYEHDALLLLSETKVTIRVPKVRKTLDIGVILPDGHVVIAQPLPVFAWDSAANAVVKGERKRTQSRMIAAMRAETDRLDLVALTEAGNALYPPAPAPVPIVVPIADKTIRAEVEARALMPPAGEPPPAPKTNMHLFLTAETPPAAASQPQRRPASKRRGAR